MQKIKLFCIPFSGGSKYSYRGFKKHEPGQIDIQSLDLPGRGDRISEPLQTNAAAMVDQLFPIIKKDSDQPYAIYGHSLGALLAYLISKRIVAEKIPPPLYLFLTGHAAPSIERKKPPRHLMSTPELTACLEEMGGMEGILDNQELMSFYEPILRADFKVGETYKYEASPPLKIPISLMFGLEEDFTEEEIKSWQKESTFPIEIQQFPGHHFFIFQYEKEIIDHISEKLIPKPQYWEI